LQHKIREADGDKQWHETIAHEPVGNRAAVQLGNRTRYRNQRQEWEYPRLDRKRTNPNLLGAKKSTEGNHAAIENRENE